MTRYTVYTDAGDFTDVWAASAEEAKRKVWYMTNGRATYINAVRS